MKCTVDFDLVQTYLNNTDKVIIYPTEAVFGIGCKANNFKAIQKIQKLKRRSPKKAFVVLASNDQQLDYLINSNISKQTRYLVSHANDLTQYLDIEKFYLCLDDNVATICKNLYNFLINNDITISENVSEQPQAILQNIVSTISKGVNLNLSLESTQKILLELYLKFLTFYHPKAINITFILPCNSNIKIPLPLLGLDQTATAEQIKQATIAIRYTHHPSLVKFANLSGDVPLVSTSCNISGKDPLITPQQVVNEFGKDELTSDICLFDQAIKPFVDPCVNQIPENKTYLRTSSPLNTSIIVDLYQLKVLRNGKFLKLQNGFKYINSNIYNTILALELILNSINIKLDLDN